MGEAEKQRRTPVRDATQKEREVRRRGRTGQSGRELLLAAATAEFAERGLEGARIDEIARRAGVNKQLVYHHFGAKDDLYREVLTQVYTDIRQSERIADLACVDPVDAMRRLVEFSFDYLDANPQFVRLLADENFHGGRHLRDEDRLSGMHADLIAGIRETLARGCAAGLFREGLDPRQVYISIAALGFFYFGNIHTLSAIFGDDLRSKEAVAARRRHVVEFVLAGLRPDPA